MKTEQTKEQIIRAGRFFSPPHLVDLVFSMAEPYIDADTVIGDLGVGAGAFFARFSESGARCFGTDVDDTFFSEIKTKYPNTDLFWENSLLHVDREKYGLRKEKLILVGNPPYNDVTSIYQKGRKGENVCDDDLKTRDLGVSFLRAYDKLNADYVCVLHPLAYLIKKQNFRSLGAFGQHYRLVKATAFSSKEFDSVQKGTAEFPVVAALYERNEEGMDFSWIQSFAFDILRSERIFRLNDIETVDGKVEKYPKKEKKGNLQFWTLRDMNALLRNAAFVRGARSNSVDVDLAHLYQYAWLFFLKNNFHAEETMFLYGNLSPLYPDAVECDPVRNLAVSYAYCHAPVVAECFSRAEIEACYGTLQNDFSALFEELKKLCIF